MTTHILTQILPVTLVSPEAPGWEWELIKHESDSYFFAKVKSPHTPDGEYGSVDVDELNQTFTLMTL